MSSPYLLMGAGCQDYFANPCHIKIISFFMNTHLCEPLLKFTSTNTFYYTNSVRIDVGYDTSWIQKGF